MQTLTVDAWTQPDVLGHQVAPEDGTLIDEPTTVVVDGHPVIVYGTMPPVDQAWRTGIVRGPYGVSSRSGGMVSRAFTFGFNPRLPLRAREFCTECGVNRKRPALAARLATFGALMEQMFSELLPEQYARQQEMVGQILPEWRLPDSSIFTGGIVNKDASLTYHVDGGNYPDAWNMMGVWREHMTGGELVIAGPRLRFAMRDSTFLLFPAQEHLHGVTPMEKRHRDGYRVSVVYFATRQLEHCLPFADEAKRARRVRTEREQRRAGMIA